MWKTELAPHFAREEDRLIPAVRGCDEALDALCDTIVQEHRAIAAAIDELAHAPEGEAAALLDALGRLLEAHVRREERILFEQIQRVTPEAVLQGLDLEA